MSRYQHTLHARYVHTQADTRTLTHVKERWPNGDKKSLICQVRTHFDRHDLSKTTRSDIEWRELENRPMKLIWKDKLFIRYSAADAWATCHLLQRADRVP